MTAKTYIIAHDEYMHVDSAMSSFTGTFRQLLEDLSNVTDENRNTPCSDEDPRTIADFTDKELLELFKSGNGDGQPFYQVWCVEDKEQVI